MTAGVRRSLLLLLPAVAAAMVPNGAPAQGQDPVQGPSKAEAELARTPSGCLPRAQLPDSLALLPPPPGAETAALGRDEEARRSVATLRGSARWARASTDTLDAALGEVAAVLQSGPRPAGDCAAETASLATP